MGRVHDFEKCRIAAERILDELDLEAVFRRHFPDYVDHAKATPEEDRAGTDYLVLCESGTRRIDIKLMLQKTPWPDSRRDNLPIELYSVKERGVKGYQGDADYVLWLYRDSLSSTMVPRKELCEFIDLKWEGLKLFRELHETKSRTRGGRVYTSSFFWLPRWSVERIGLKSVQAA